MSDYESIVTIRNIIRLWEDARFLSNEALSEIRKVLNHD